MLVLSRKLFESIHIGTSIRLRVLRISGDSVRLGIDAPADVPIWRTELLDAAPAAHVPPSLALKPAEA